MLSGLRSRILLRGIDTPPAHKVLLRERVDSGRNYCIREEAFMPTSPSPQPVSAIQSATDRSPPTNESAGVTGIKFEHSPRPTLASSQQDGRRPSIQFATHASENILRSESPKPSRRKLKIQQRFTSPPPPT